MIQFCRIILNQKNFLMIDEISSKIDFTIKEKINNFLKKNFKN